MVNPRAGPITTARPPECLVRLAVEHCQILVQAIGLIVQAGRRSARSRGIRFRIVHRVLDVAVRVRQLVETALCRRAATRIALQLEAADAKRAERIIAGLDNLAPQWRSLPLGGQLAFEWHASNGCTARQLEAEDLPLPSLAAQGPVICTSMLDSAVCSVSRSSYALAAVSAVVLSTNSPKRPTSRLGI